MGLVGFYFIRDANEDRLRATNVLPSYPYEIPLALMDRTFDQNGQLFYPSEDPAGPIYRIRRICPNSSVT